MIIASQMEGIFLIEMKRKKQKKANKDRKVGFIPIGNH